MEELAGRNISIQRYFEDLGRSHRPRLRFGAANNNDFAKWKAELLPKLIESLGKMPKKVPLNPQIVKEWREDGLIKQRVMIDVEAGLSAPLLVYRPENVQGRLPAILCCHGHGPFGKDAVMGIASDESRRANIKEHNYHYGLKMAQAGFVTLAIDWRGFGERDDRNEKGFSDKLWGRDLCNVHYIRASLMGMTVLGMDVHDGQCALDYLCSLDFVDPNRIGAMGLSFGGTMTTWMTLCDARIKAADIIGYSDRFADFAMARMNFCGSQITPGLYDLCDMPDLHGLIAPRPLLIEIGKQDTTFFVESAMSCYKEVEKIYIAADAHEKLALDLFDSGHQWGANLSERFFRKNLT